MTSRLAPGGLQSLIGLSPDLTTFGKYLGGGLAFGAFGKFKSRHGFSLMRLHRCSHNTYSQIPGGKEEIMQVYDPRSPTSLAHSGTFNNNTLAMHAGFVGLQEIWTPSVAVAFNAMGDGFRKSLEKATNGTKMSVTGQGALNAIHFTETGARTISCKEDVDEIWALKDLFFMEIMEDGFWITRRGSIALILGTPQSELDRFVECVGKFLGRHSALVAL